MKNRKKVHSFKKWLLIGLGTCLVIFIIGLMLVGNYFYNLALNPTMPKEAIFGAASGDNTNLEKEEAQKWLEETTHYKDIYRVSYDDLKLHAYEIKSEEPSDTWIIEVHGYMGSGKDMARCSRVYHEGGYNILIPDLRGQGSSEGTYIGMGWHDRLDMLGWIDYVLGQDQNAQIVLYGVSMGGATVMMTAGEELPSNVKAIIEDCGYSSAWEQFAYTLETLFEIPTYPVIPAANLITKIRAGYWLSEASAVKQVAKSKTPILFIHGEEDTFVPFFMLDKVYEAANCEKEKLIVPGASHAASAEIAPDLYKKTVEAFLAKYIKDNANQEDALEK